MKGHITIKKISIGRDEHNDICIPESFDTVSNRHADIELLEDGKLCLTDYSRNGTTINGVRINHASKYITYGDKILLSRTYELSWWQIERFFPQIRNYNVSSNARSQLHSSRDTELINQEVVFNQQPVSFPNERNIDIEKAKNSWNWGAFLLSWIWALGHACWWPFIVILILLLMSYITIVLIFPLGVSFLIMINLFQIALSIYLGIKGNSIAWENGCFENIDHFRRKERGWTIAGVIVLISCIVISIILAVSTFLFGVALFI